jgi:hypothetical protein
MLLAIANAAKFAQNCQNLPKFAQRQLWNSTKNQDFSICQKNKIICIEEALEHISAIWIFNPRIFHMLFLLFLKIGLCL